MRNCANIMYCIVHAAFVSIKLMMMMMVMMMMMLIVTIVVTATIAPTTRANSVPASSQIPLRALLATRW